VLSSYPTVEAIGPKCLRGQIHQLAQFARSDLEHKRVGQLVASGPSTRPSRRSTASGSRMRATSATRGPPMVAMPRRTCATEEC